MKAEERRPHPSLHSQKGHSSANAMVQLQHCTKHRMHVVARMVRFPGGGANSQLVRELGGWLVTTAHLQLAGAHSGSLVLEDVLAERIDAN